MDELKSEVEKLNKARSFNFYFYLALSLYYIGIIFYGYTLAEKLAAKIFLAYLALNILTSALLVLGFLRKKVNFSESKLKDGLAKAMYASDLAPLTFVIPIFISSIVLIILDYIHDNEAEVWVCVSIGIFYVLGVYRVLFTRKIIRKLYKKVFGIDYLSFFHF